MKKILSLLALTALTIGLLGSCCKKEDPKVSVTGVSLDKTELTITVGDQSVQLTATVAPENATDKTVSWSSDKTEFATVDNQGNVHAVAPGTANITVTTTDGNKTATCVVTVVTGRGIAKRTGDIDVKWIQLWEDGPKFAEYNVGVTDGKAESYGGYYCWGKAIDKDSSGSYKDGESALSGDDDTATKLWGSNWRMPTQAELDALLSSCDVEWMDGSTKKYKDTNIIGLLCTGKGAYASNSVFLPAAYFYDGGNVTGQVGYYWSSTPSGGDYAYYLTFSSSIQIVARCYYRYYGCSVRAVLAE